MPTDAYPRPVPDEPLDDDHALAGALATRAGDALVTLQAELIGRGADRWTLMDSGDLTAQRLLASALATERPLDAVLSEEAADDRRTRLAADRVWIVDPLDGTQEFGDPGRREWAVHVALVEAGAVTAAAVALPGWGRLLTTRPAPSPPPGLDGRRHRVVTSRWRPPGPAVALAHALDADLIGLGGAGAKIVAIVLGQADAYAPSGLYEWDAAAPVGVALAAGLHVSHFDGSPVTFNHPEPWVAGLLVCRPELAQTCLAALAALGSAP